MFVYASSLQLPNEKVCLGDAERIRPIIVPQYVGRVCLGLACIFRGENTSWLMGN